MFQATPNEDAAHFAANADGATAREGARSLPVSAKGPMARLLPGLLYAALATLALIAFLPVQSAHAQSHSATYLPNVSASELSGASGAYFPGDTLVYDNEGAWELVYDGVDERGLWLRLVERTTPQRGGGYFASASRTQGGYFRSQQARATSPQVRTSYLRIPHSGQGGYWRVQSDDGRRQLGMSYERGALIVASP